MNLDELCAAPQEFLPSRLALRKASRLVGDRTGIIRRLTINVRGSDDPAVFQAYAEPSRIDSFNCVPGANQGAACDLSAEDAAMRALGECVERYCGAIYDRTKFRKSTYGELNKEEFAVDPREFTLFSQDQYDRDNFPFSCLSHTSTLSWVRGFSLTHGRAVYIPASFVYVPYNFDMKHEFPSHMPISTGLAAGPNPTYAVMKGILEIIERDAFMIAWRNQLPLQQIDIKSIGNSAVRKLIDACTTTGGTWYVLKLPSDLPLSIIMTVLINEQGLPKTSFGACASLDPIEAVKGAMKESLLTRYYINYMLRTNQNNNEIFNKSRSEDYSWVRTLSDHAVVHAINDKLRDRLISLFKETTELGLTYHEAQHPLRFLISSLAKRGLNVYYYDVTTPDVGSAGISVVKVLIPGMQPLDNDHLFPHEGGNRLYEMPITLGFRSQRSSIGDLTSLPHPFP